MCYFFSTMESSSPSAIQSSHVAAKSDFLRRLRDSKDYQRLAPILGVDVDRLARFEQSCWLHSCAAAKNDFKGPRAKRAQAHLERLRHALGNSPWLEDSVAESLRDLDRELAKLASRTGRGRPRDSIGRSFLRNMQNFIPLAHAHQRTNRSISQDEINEILSGIFQVVFGRKISETSFTRMRIRYKVRK